MKRQSFLYLMHMDRFGDLAKVIGDHEIVVRPISMDEDDTVVVRIAGEGWIIRKLHRSLHRLADILSSSPVREEV